MRVKGAGKQKAKKAKGKGKGKSKEQWSHEGGALFAEGKHKAQGKSLRGKPRKTQEKDEWRRRGHLKVLMRQKTEQLVKKLSSKVRFTDVLDEPLDDKAVAKPKRDRIEPPSPNNVSPLLRLRAFMKEGDESDSDIDNDEIDAASSDEEDELEEENENSSGALNMKPLADGDAEVAEATEQDIVIEDSVDDSEEYDYWRYKQFSTASAPDQTAGAKPTVYEALGDMEVLGTVSFDTQQLVRVKSVGDVPNLPSLWQSRACDRFGSKLESMLLSYLLTFGDTMIEGRDYQNDVSMIKAAMFHIAVHMVKAKSQVIKHNQALKAKATAQKIQSSSSGNQSSAAAKKGKRKASESDISSVDSSEQQFQDQGFVPPRVLILCPFRGTARKLIYALKEALGKNTTISKAAQFDEEFGYVDDDESEEDESDDEECSTAGANWNSKVKVSKSQPSSDAKKKRSKKKSRMPPDWEALFKDNSDDDFKFGIQFHPHQGKGAGRDKGVYLKLFSDFYSSDIIVASPLGLKLAVENSGNVAADSKPNFDFLSSIELVLLHQADVMYMQNWEHVEYILSQANRMPVTDRGTDFSRVRPYFLEGQASLHRQIILTTEFNSPAIQAAFRMFSRSIAGTVRFKRYSGVDPAENALYDATASMAASSKKRGDQRGMGAATTAVGRINKSGYLGSISNVVKTNTAQLFQRVDCMGGLKDAEEAKFKYFCDQVLNHISKSDQSRVLIYCPSYFNYVRVRNEILRREMEAVFICEYSRESEISRGRSRFFHGLRNICVYSGRAHFFRRFQIRGVANLIFYGAPEQSSYYSEMVNLLGEAEQVGFEVSESGEKRQTGPLEVSSLLLFTIYEKMALERIVGKDRCDQMITSIKTSFVFR